MKAHIIKIGNSQGLRIPKTLLKQSGLSGEVELVVENESIIIRPSRTPRSGWDEAFAEMAECREDGMLEQEVILDHSFDETEWEWK